VLTPSIVKCCKRFRWELILTFKIALRNTERSGETIWGGWKMCDLPRGHFIMNRGIGGKLENDRKMLHPVSGFIRALIRRILGIAGMSKIIT
jgi:hypothetical protein